MTTRQPSSGFKTEDLPEPGDVIHVRARKWLVEEVEVSDTPGAMTPVKLACLEDDAQGDKLEILWEAEVDAKPVDADTWGEAARRGFDDPARFAAYLYTLRWGNVTATNPNIFQAPYRAGIDVMSYQLEPLRKAIRLPRVNMFIADDVGLGKTIEAGLILREMLIRQKVKRVVVAAPPSVVLQWQQEMETRFGLGFEIYDRDFVARKRREYGWATNPWTTHTRFIISHALLRDEAYAGPMRDWLGDFSPGSMLIMDEAHHAAPASGSANYAIDSKLTRTVREVSRHFEHRLFLSATPHNGHSNSFSALLELLDPQRFTRAVPIKSARELDEVMVRRLKSDLRELAGTDFPERVVEEISIDGLDEDDPELVLAELLDSYRKVRTSQVKSGDISGRGKSAVKLVLISLQKRLSSSIEAFARTLGVHKAAVERKRSKQSVPQLDLEDVMRGEESELTDEELEQREEHAIALASRLERTDAVDDLLEQMSDVAQRARSLPDAKMRALVDWIRQELCHELPEFGAHEVTQGAMWAPKRVIIFTEYMDTMRYIKRQLQGIVSLTDQGEQRIATYHGGLGEDSREQIKQSFNADPERDPLRILIATDAAREGVNLQNHCADLFHFDIPWNPARMEQRNGRIDRKLQRSPQVRCHYFVLEQRPEDKVLKTLVKKTERIQAELGSLSAVVMDQLSQQLQDGISRDAIDSQSQAIENLQASGKRREVVEQELETTRRRKKDLQDELEKLRVILERSEKDLNFDRELFRNVIDQALILLGAKPLEPLNKEQTIFRFPDLEEVVGADISWRATLDSLRRARHPGEEFWRWRKDAPLRPVIFEDAGQLDADRVHLHLEHLLVKRLMALFTAQGSKEDLSRVTVVSSEGKVPRIVLVGRLSLFGEGAARLHTELVPVTARWIADGGLEPYKSTAEATTLDQLQHDLGARAHIAIPGTTRDLLAGRVASDIEDLQSVLEERAAEAAEKARGHLDDRGEREAKAMLDILERQRRNIHEQQNKYDTQGVLTFDAAERRQLDADRQFWTERLEELEVEMIEEPARIKRAYAVRVQRLEPVGVIYLWPHSG